MIKKPVKVSQLTDYIKMLIESDNNLFNISITGETSNLKTYGNGHTYFTLKDKESQIDCVVFSGTKNKISHIFDKKIEGKEVILIGKLNVYKPSGRYNFIVSDMKLSGEGDLSVEYEKLKLKLTNEGLFDEKYKKTITKFPNNIMIITSDKGAAVEDIKRTILEKNSYVNIYIMPTLVQGERAGKDIANAIEEANEKYSFIDTIILGRGGGSIEDLWAFNEEIVIRAIFDSKIPIISAIGHETDTTLSDYVSDIRALTPTAAANLAVPDTEELKNINETNKMTILKLLEDNISRKIKFLESHNLAYLLNNINKDIIILDNKANEHLDSLKSSIQNKQTKAETLLQKNYTSLEALSPLNVLKRGYGMVIGNDNKPIASIENIKKDDNLKVQLSDGKIHIKVISLEKN